MNIKMSAAIVLSLCVSGFSQVGPTTLRMSPAPLWPSNGDISGFPADQYVFLNPSVSEYIVAIRATDGSVERTIRAPIHNQVVPEVTTSVSKDSEGRFHYIFTVSNGVSAEAEIQHWSLAVQEVGHKVTVSHPSWTGGRSATKLPGLSHEQHEVHQWISPEDGGIRAGETLAGFEVVSDLAPGYLLGAFYGNASTPELTPEVWASLPEPASNQLRNALGTAWDSQTLQVIGPRFASDAGLMAVEANFGFGINNLRTRNRIAKDSAVGKELESTLNDALTHPDPVLPLSSLSMLDKLRPNEGSREAEALSALQLTLAWLQAK